VLPSLILFALLFAYYTLRAWSSPSGPFLSFTLVLSLTASSKHYLIQNGDKF
jgi:hypothetical protein